MKPNQTSPAVAGPIDRQGRRQDCTTCGACCAYSYDWPELSDEDTCEGIDDSLIDMEHGRMKCSGDRCNALAGEIGVSVRCVVYRDRPKVCREFDPCQENCDMVRQWFGLAPLAYVVNPNVELTGDDRTRAASGSAPG